MTSLSPARLLGAAAALALAAAAPARATTLAEAIAYAYETNPGLQSQRAALRALDETYVQARSGYGLQIAANASALNNNYKIGAVGPQQPHGTETLNQDNESVSIVQPLWTGGRVAARVTQAEAQIKTGRENLRRFELDLLTRVVTAYVDVRRDEQLLVINQDTVAVLERELSDAEAKFKVRQLTATDTAQSKARLAQSRSSLVAVQAQLAVSRAQYLAAVGQNPTDLAPPPPVDGLPETIEKAFSAAEEMNPQLRAAVFGELGSRARVREARAGKLPTVTARVDFSRGPLSGPFEISGELDTRAASINFSQPIYTSGQLTSQIRQATEENNRDRLNIDDVRLQVTQNVSAAWEQLSASRRQVATFEDEVKADEFAFYGVRQEEKFALRSQIEVLNAELELTNAQQNLVRVRAQEYAGRVQLLSNVGTLDARTFAPKTPRYATIAAAVGLSEAAVRQRVTRLIGSGVVQIVAVTDPLQVGFSRQAMIGIKAEGNLDPVVAALTAMDEVAYVVITAGSFDILAEIVCEDDDHLLSLLNHRIRTIDGIRSTESFMYLKLSKQTYTWGTR